MKTQILKSRDIVCDHCATTIRKALATLPGVRKVKVDIDAQEVSVEYAEEQLDRATLEARMAEEGYPVVDPEGGIPQVQPGDTHCCGGGGCHV